MASSIVRSVIGGEVDTKISLLNSNIARIHNITQWNSIRVAIRFQFGISTGATITGSPLFAVGLCSGNGIGDLLFDATTQHFVGVYSSGAQFTFNSSQGNYYTATMTAAKKVSTTWTPDNSSTATHFFGASGGNVTRTLLFVDITKGSPNYSINLFSHNSFNGAFTNPTLSNFLEQLELQPPIFDDHAYVNGSVAVNEGVDGVLDNILIAWNGSPQTCEISDIGVVRLS